MEYRVPTVEQCESTALVLKALAHPQRLLILCLISGGELTVGEIERKCGASQSLVSQYLARMKREGLIESRREGSFVYYRIRDPRVKKLILAMHKVFC